jgi:multicomponent Na+:H+ antiporter subunit E
VTHRGAAPAGDRHVAGGRIGNVRWWLQMAPFLVAFWLLLSGHVEPLLLALGAFSVALVCWLFWRTGLTRPVGATGRVIVLLPGYFLWLATEVLVSAVAVVRTVWSPRPTLVPTVAATSSVDLPELLQVVYANSITLTPGTLSLDVGEEYIEVHSLDPAGVKDLHDGAMLRRVRRLGVPQ